MGRSLGSICVYGPSGSGKTTQAGELAVYVAARHSKQTRLASCSGGGWKAVQPHVDKGIMIPCRISDWPNPFETVDRLSKGWWPEHADDPESPLLPPEKQKNFRDVGAWVFDSLTEGCDWAKSALLAREAAGTIRISTEGVTARWKDGETNYATASRAYYGTIQDNYMTFITQSRRMPDRYVMWTALELRADDGVTRLPVYGPDIIGRAKTGSAPAWFEDTLHLSMGDSINPMTKMAEKVYRMHLTKHTLGDDPVPYLAKTRAPLGTVVPEMLEGSHCSLFEFLTLMEACTQAGSNALEQRIVGINPSFFAEIALNVMSPKTKQ